MRAGSTAAEVQAHLAVDDTVGGIIGDAELDWADDRKLRFIAQNVVDALAPSNSPLVNPAVLKGAIDTGGASFVRGARHFAQDMREPPRLPANIDVSKFAVGRDLAVSPGAVVLRDERFELIQYKPTTPEVREVPILLVPPMINKFYIMDLAPGRSHIEHLVQSGQEVQPMSWRNPGAEQRGWGLDVNAERGVFEAFDAVLDISGCDRTHVVGYCAGGLVAAATASHLAAVGRLEQLASLTLGVCVIDNEHSNVLGAVATEEILNVAARGLGEEGIPRRARPRECLPLASPERPHLAVRGEQLAARGRSRRRSTSSTGTQTPPACLRRCTGTSSGARQRTRCAGQVASRCSARRSTSAAITVDSYLIAGAADHISPWQNCHRTTQLLGGSTRFARSTSGHIAAIVNPPGNKRANYRTADEQTPPDPARVGGAREDEPGHLVGGLGGMAGRALGRGAPRARAARQPAAQARGRGTRGVRPREVSRRQPSSRRCARNSLTSAADRSASSRRKRWPPPGITSSRACGNRRARMRPLASGMIGSSSPAMTSVGWSIDGNQG